MDFLSRYMQRGSGRSMDSPSFPRGKHEFGSRVTRNETACVTGAEILEPRPEAPSRPLDLLENHYLLV